MPVIYTQSMARSSKYSSAVIGAGVIVTFFAGCTCTTKPVNGWTGMFSGSHGPPDLCTPQDFAHALTNKPNETVGTASQAVGLFTTLFKNIGMQGWTDF